MKRRVPIENYHRKTDPTARKKHTCCECHAAILIGEAYHRRTGCQDLYCYDYKTCRQCEVVFQAAKELGIEGGPIVGQLMPFLAKHNLRELAGDFSLAQGRREWAAKVALVQEREAAGK
jgi:hypothetical protein